MVTDQEAGRREVRRQGEVLIDGLLNNGIDCLAARRAHMREITMARQVAEQRFARLAHPTGRDGSTTVHERTAAFRAELARINALHRTWLLAQGDDVQERVPRQRRMAVTSVVAVVSSTAV